MCIFLSWKLYHYFSTFFGKFFFFFLNGCVLVGGCRAVFAGCVRKRRYKHHLDECKDEETFPFGRKLNQISVCLFFPPIMLVISVVLNGMF